MAATIDKSFILAALRSGFADSQIAEALGVTSSAVAQLIDAHGLRAMAVKNSRFSTIDENLTELEDELVKKLKQQVRFVQDPMKIGRLLQIVNSTKRRSLAEGQAPNLGQARLVQLNLPERLRISVEFNAENELVSVNGRSMATATPGRVIDQVTKPVEEQSNGPALPPAISGRRSGGESIASLL